VGLNCSCFYICRRPLKFVGPSMPAKSFILPTGVIAYFFRVLFIIRIFLYFYEHPSAGTTFIFTNISFQLLSYTFLSYITRAWGMPRLVCTQFIFHTLRKVGSYKFPSPSIESLLILSISLFLTIVISVEETLMNFSYTYAPNLIHQGASVITEILSANGYRNPASPNSY